jgi:hypothetical protein
MEMSGRFGKRILWLGFLFFLLVALSSPCLADCAVDPGVSLAITKFGWTLNSKTGSLQVEAEVLNVSEWDVVDPGVVVSLLDSTGHEFGSWVVRSSLKRIRPNEKGRLTLAVKIPSIPGTIKVLPYQGKTGT